MEKHTLGDGQFCRKIEKTRPDTRPIPVADGWAGAEMRVFTLFDSCSRTYRRTDKGSYRVACPQLKMVFAFNTVMLG